MSRDIQIETIVVGPVQTNCMVVYRSGSDNCVVIDPGEEAGRIADRLRQRGLKNQGILLTHGHFDHITGVSELVSLAGGKVYAYEGERDLMIPPALNGSAMMGYELGLEPECLLRDGEILSLADMDFRVIHTPGHTSGSCCFYMEREQILFSGDTVFLESVGRTDFPTGSSSQLLESLRKKVLTLPEHVKIYPGHGPDTSVSYEKQNNPYAGLAWQ